MFVDLPVGPQGLAVGPQALAAGLQGQAVGPLFVAVLVLEALPDQDFAPTRARGTTSVVPQRSLLQRRQH